MLDMINYVSGCDSYIQDKTRIQFVEAVECSFRYGGVGPAILSLLLTLVEAGWLNGLCNTYPL